VISVLVPDCPVSSHLDDERTSSLNEIVRRRKRNQ
jgi:hypothetical protein